MNSLRYCSKNMNETVVLKPNLFSGLITSKTRIRVLMRLFLNPQRTAYLRELASECGASPSQMRDELKQLGDAGLLVNERQGRQEIDPNSITREIELALCMSNCE